MGDDIDEEEDVWRLADRVCGDGGGGISCPHTLHMLIELGLVEEKSTLTSTSVPTTGRKERVVYVVKRDS